MRYLVIVVVAAILLHAPAAFACSCMQPPPPPQALADASSVFEGEITAVNTPEQGRVVATFRVLRAWKGVNQPEVVVHTAGDSAACGLSFAAGQRWLLYTHLSENNTHANLCSRSTQESAADIAALGAPTYTPASEPGGTPPPAPAPEPPPPSTPPAAEGGGCAGCSVGGRGLDPWWLGLLALAALRRRTRA